MSSPQASRPAWSRVVTGGGHDAAAAGSPVTSGAATAAGTATAAGASTAAATHSHPRRPRAPPLRTRSPTNGPFRSSSGYSLSGSWAETVGAARGRNLGGTLAAWPGSAPGAGDLAGRGVQAVEQVGHGDDQASRHAATVSIRSSVSPAFLALAAPPC